MLQFNINGTTYRNTDTCKLYNLSAQQLHSLDIYMMTSNIEANDWILSLNEDNTPKIQIEIDRFVIPGAGTDAYGETHPDTVIDGQKFNIAISEPGESFSHPIIYARKQRMVEDSVLDDNAHIQKLPSHSAIPQESVLMLGGTTSLSVVRELWGKVRATAPLYPPLPLVPPTILSQEEQDKWIANSTFNEYDFYEDRSEWYINMATRDDFLRVDLHVSSSTNIAELDLYMNDILFIIQPSQHSRLKKNYMYYDTDDEPPRIQTTGVTY